jgi:hypothetical protein
VADHAEAAHFLHVGSASLMIQWREISWAAMLPVLRMVMW